MAYWNCGKVPCSRKSVRTKPVIRAVPPSSFLWEVTGTRKVSGRAKGKTEKKEKERNKGTRTTPDSRLARQVSSYWHPLISSYSGWAPHCNLGSHVVFFLSLSHTQTWWKIHYFLFFVKFNIFLILHLEFRRSWFILSAYTYVTMRYVLNRFFPSFMEYLTPWLIDLARLPTRNVIWELETATQLTLWYPTYISTGDLCLNTNSLPFFRRRKVGFEVPALREDNQHRFITKFSLNDLDFYSECPL